MADPTSPTGREIQSPRFTGRNQDLRFTNISEGDIPRFKKKIPEKYEALMERLLQLMDGTDPSPFNCTCQDLKDMRRVWQFVDDKRKDRGWAIKITMRQMERQIYFERIAPETAGQGQ